MMLPRPYAYTPGIRGPVKQQTRAPLCGLAGEMTGRFAVNGLQCELERCPPHVGPTRQILDRAASLLTL